MHILFIPSWYPQFYGDISGSFFKFRAENISRNIDKAGVIFAGKISVKEVFSRKNGEKYAVDDIIPTIRTRYINWTPRLWRAIDSKYVDVGLSLYEKYQSECGKPDIIHCYSALSAGFLALELKKRLNIPFVVSEHASLFFRRQLDQRFRIQRAKDIFLSADAVYAVSSLFAGQLQRTFPGNINFGVIPNPVNDLFLEGELSLNASEEFVVTHISLLDRNKRVSDLLYAFHLVFKGFARVKLNIVGDGPELPRLKSLVSKLGLSRQVVFHGSLDSKAIKSILADTSALVQTSQFETFGNVLVEALAMGVPLISTDCGGPRDIINRDNGLLVRVGDVKGIAETMLSVFNNTQRYQKELLRDDCRKRFSSEVIAKMWLEVYKKLQRSERAAIP